MKTLSNLLMYLAILCPMFSLSAQEETNKRGYYDAPYIRYEADFANLTNATVTPQSYNQADLQSEASDQVCVDMTKEGAAVEWKLWAKGNGLVVRYSVPDDESGELDVQVEGKSVGTLKLTSYYSWEYLWKDDNPNNGGVVNKNPKFRFDEVRMLLPEIVPAKGSVKLVRLNGNIHIDFAEIELVKEPINAAQGDVIYRGDGSDLKTFVDQNGGETIFLPKGKYDVPTDIYFGKDSTKLKGAGSWYTQIHFTSEKQWNGGLLGNAKAVSYSGLFLTTVRNSRSKTYKGINGVYTKGSIIEDVWAEHFECGAWIANYVGGPVKYADGLVVRHCRFRNNYADGINLCKGTINSVVEHCNFRNNGDDDMAIWSANNQECTNNEYRYNTSENCWRASGVAIYGGKNNRAHHLLIKDNLEVGIRVNNAFPGSGFNSDGMHEFSDITIVACGTFNDLFNNPVGAIDIASVGVSCTMIKNVSFKNIDVVNSKNDAIYFNKTNGHGFENIVFENITVDGTGREVPHNNVHNRDWGRGFGLIFAGRPVGYGKYTNVVYKNIGGNVTDPEFKENIGTFEWAHKKPKTKKVKKKKKQKKTNNTEAKG